MTETLSSNRLDVELRNQLPGGFFRCRTNQVLAQVQMRGHLSVIHPFRDNRHDGLAPGYSHPKLEEKIRRLDGVWREEADQNVTLLECPLQLFLNPFAS